jgi:radical SAM superfamily enzyme YgiQ (UPF0313 family)
MGEKMSDIAFLVYGKKFSSANRKDKSFDGQSNIGAYIIKDVFERAGYSISFASPEFADKYKIVLVSFTSSYDMLNFLKEVIPLKIWKKRKFKVIAGGFGLQNIYSIRNYVDYGVFGRAENNIVSLIESILQGKEFHHESIMDLSQGITPVKICQVDNFYPHSIDIQPVAYKETMIGCAKKCLFCHYTFSRKHLSSDKFSTPVKYSSSSQEILFKELVEKSKGKGKIRSALDGHSERLRCVFNKRIKNDDIVNILSELSHKWENNICWLYIYLIGNYPSETEKDRNELKEVLSRVKIKQGKKMVLNFHVSLFRPSPLTPAAYLPVNLDFNYSKADYNIYNSDNITATYDWTRESFYNFLIQVIIERATEKTDDLLLNILFNKQISKMDSNQKYNTIKNHFDISDYIREYSTEERLPTWYLESYIGNHKIKQMADILKRKLYTEVLYG